MLATLLILQSALPQTPVMPFAWLKACATQPMMHCKVAELSPADIAYLNVSINHGIRFKADTPGEIERWEVFPTDGDCSAYVLSKRAALLALGMDPKRLTIVLGEVERDGKWRKHMVLEVALPDRVWILDLTDKPYVSDNRPFPWREDARQPTNGALWTLPEPTG